MNKNLFSLFIALCFIFFSAKMPEEGMYPLSELKKVDLKKAGLRISQTELYNPDGISLIDALVNVGGCTGSFVSETGLIITNHHCAFSAVQLASTPEKDYLTNGFVAAAKEEEVEAKGLTCRITESYEDVSARVLEGIEKFSDPAERLKAINEKIAGIVKDEEEKDKTIKAEVSEMFIGKTYVLFRYKTILDVRLVYVPRRTIGEFGGESDNWIWPRHTGDFSFLRAYVAPDGSPAKYSPDNVPFKPKRFLRVNPNGVNEGDFVFILGYPGRTFRHRPSQFLEQQERFTLPYISELYEWQNQQMMETSEGSKELELKQATRIKRNANVLKNYKGKLKGLHALKLVEKKKQEELELQKFINKDPELKNKYGSLLGDIDKLYQEMFSDAKREMWYGQIYNSSNLLSVANQLVNFRQKMLEESPEEQSAYFADHVSRIQNSIRGIYETYVPETDRRLLRRMIADANNLPGNQRVWVIDKHIKGNNVEGSVNTLMKKLFSTKLDNPAFVENILKDREKFLKLKDPMLSFASDLAEQGAELALFRQRREGTLNRLMADYVDVKMKFKKTSFIPDANSTLRLTYGYVRGYNPADAVYMAPVTTLTGLTQKGSKEGDYELSPVIYDLYEKKDFGRFKSTKLNDVPVAFLYNLDTSGGNSGSPVMNDKGELVGVNFDRAFEATINDYAWNEAYSRSIGVDIRYVLWVAQKVDNAGFILKELGVSEK